MYCLSFGWMLKVANPWCFFGTTWFSFPTKVGSHLWDMHILDNRHMTKIYAYLFPCEVYVGGSFFLVHWKCLILGGFIYNDWIIFSLFFITDKIILYYFADCLSRTTMFMLGLLHTLSFMLLDIIYFIFCSSLETTDKYSVLSVWCYMEKQKSKKLHFS